MSSVLSSIMRVSSGKSLTSELVYLCTQFEEDKVSKYMEGKYKVPQGFPENWTTEDRINYINNYGEWLWDTDQSK